LRGRAERPRSFVLTDRQPRLAQKEVATTERVADSSLDDGLVDEAGVDAGLSLVERRAERDLAP
jgi:hypothetical protein